MPGDPKDCRRHAARCEELADTADTPEQARILRNLAKQWLKLAADLERALRFTHGRKVRNHRRYARSR